MSMKIDQCKHPGIFRFISLGDVHLGHHQTTTASIIKNLDRYCTNEVVLKDIDMLIITGDLFDRLLHNADDNVTLIQRWITRLLYKCSYLNVAIRIVEGTPSHDRGQSRFFVEQMVNANIEVDLHYASTLSIEENERFGINILYVPDKWRPDTQETYSEVLTLMERHQLKQVDFAIMHGAFEYQLPAMVPEPTFDSKAYLDIVKYYILVGHVHFASQRERILAAGSYDRICHGEEGPKGYYRVELRELGDALITFVENKGARKYVTVNCHGKEIQEVNVELRNVVKALPKDSAIRLRCDPNDPVSGYLEAIQKQYPDHHWTLTIDKPKATKTSVIELFREMDLEELEEITPDTFQAMMNSELKRLVSDTATIERCTQLLTRHG